MTNQNYQLRNPGEEYNRGSSSNYALSTPSGRSYDPNNGEGYQQKKDYEVS